MEKEIEKIYELKARALLSVKNPMFLILGKYKYQRLLEYVNDVPSRGITFNKINKFIGLRIAILEDGEDEMWVV